MALLALGINSPTSATSAQHSDPGVLGVSTGAAWADMLTFSDPNVTAKFSVTGASYGAPLSANTCMTTDTCGFWGADDEDGYNCYDSGGYVAGDCDYATSQVNSGLAFSPNSVSSTEGVTWVWRSPVCGNVATDYPKPTSPIVDCLNVGTVTIQFSAPVSNAVLHLANIGGLGNYPRSRKTNFTTGFDMTLFSKWKLMSGQSMVMLSGGETTNIMLDGNVIRNRFTPNGAGARVSNRECGYNEIACSYDNGTGSGSFLVLGTYSTLTFNIDLSWSLVNYGPSNPAGLGTMQQWGSFDIPEGVSVQLSFYEEGPALPTTTIAPTTTTIAPTTTKTAPTKTLPETGNQNSLMSLLVATSLIAMGVLVRRRLRA